MFLKPEEKFLIVLETRGEISYCSQNRNVENDSGITYCLVFILVPGIGKFQIDLKLRCVFLSTASKMFII